MVKPISQQKPAWVAPQTAPVDSRAPPDSFHDGHSPDEVAVGDLNDLFDAAITRLAQWVVEPPESSGVMLACVQALRQLHLTAANELLRRQQTLDGQP